MTSFCLLFRPHFGRFLPRLLLLCVGMMLLANLPARAFTSADADTILNAYKKAFYQERGKSGYFKKTEKDLEPNYFWGQAEEIEGILDAAERTKDRDHQKWVSQLLDGFSAHEKTIWAGNKYNDDIMWACIAFARGYLLTGDKRFRKIAKDNFDLVWERGWDTKGGGGIWWTTEKTTKNSCVVFPAAVAAHLLSQCFNDPKYLAKAQQIYDWGKEHLWNPETGQVYDSVTSKTPTTYNQGTFVGAADFLGDVKSAALVSKYTMEHMGGKTWNGYRLMPQYGIDQNNSGFNAIGLRWIAKFVVAHNLHDSFLGWLQTNANAAWDVRRTKDNLSWCQWREPSPEKVAFDSWDCISSVVALQVVPPDIIPAAPAGIAAEITEDGATVRWTSETGYARAYHVKRATEEKGPYATLATVVKDLAYQDTECEADTSYYYVVSAITEAGEGPDSIAAIPTEAEPSKGSKKPSPANEDEDNEPKAPQGPVLKMPEGHRFDPNAPTENPEPPAPEGETPSPETPAPETSSAGEATPAENPAPETPSTESAKPAGEAAPPETPTPTDKTEAHP